MLSPAHLYICLRILFLIIYFLVIPVKFSTSTDHPTFSPACCCCLKVTQDAHHCCLSDRLCSLVLSSVSACLPLPHLIYLLSSITYLLALPLWVCLSVLPVTECKPPLYQVKPFFIISVLPHGSKNCPHLWC